MTSQNLHVKTEPKSKESLFNVTTWYLHCTILSLHWFFEDICNSWMKHRLALLQPSYMEFSAGGVEILAFYPISAVTGFYMWSAYQIFSPNIDDLILSTHPYDQGS